MTWAQTKWEHVHLPPPPPKKKKKKKLSIGLGNTRSKIKMSPSPWVQIGEGHAPHYLKRRHNNVDLFACKNNFTVFACKTPLPLCRKCSVNLKP